MFWVVFDLVVSIVEVQHLISTFNSISFLSWIVKLFLHLRAHIVCLNSNNHHCCYHQTNNKAHQHTWVPQICHSTIYLNFSHALINVSFVRVQDWTKCWVYFRWTFYYFYSFFIWSERVYFLLVFLLYKSCNGKNCRFNQRCYLLIAVNCQKQVFWMFVFKKIKNSNVDCFSDYCLILF